MSDQKTSTASYAASSGTMLVCSLTTNDIVMFIGAFCALATFAVNWYYKHKHYKLAEARASIAEEVEE